MYSDDEKQKGKNVAYVADPFTSTIVQVNLVWGLASN